MSGSIIKNAVIVIGVEQGKVNFRMPDLDPILKAREKEIELLKKAEQQAVTVAQAEMAARIKQITLSERLAAARRNQATVEVEAAQAAVAAQQQLEQDVQRAQSLMLRHMQEGGRGVFQLTRGFILLGVSGEENLRKVMNALALVQGGFDIFRGAANITRSVVAVTNLLAVAKQAETIAETANTAATVANTTAKTASAGAAVTLLSAVNPVTLAIGLAVVAMTAAAAASKAWGDETAELTRRQKKWAEQIDIGTESIRRQQAGRDRLRSMRSLSFGDSTRGEARDIQNEAAFNAEQMHLLGRAMREGPGGKDAAALGQRSLELAKRNQDLLDRSVSLQKQFAEAKARANEESIRDIQNQERAVDLARQRLDAEQKRVQTTVQALGQLDEMGMAKLGIIAGKQKRGEALSLEEEKFIGGLGPQGAEFAGRGFEKRAGASGAIGLLETVIKESLTGKRDEATRRLEEEEADLRGATGGKRVKEAIADLEADSLKVTTLFDEYLDRMAKVAANLQDSVGDLESRQERLEMLIHQANP